MKPKVGMMNFSHCKNWAKLQRQFKEGGIERVLDLNNGLVYTHEAPLGSMAGLCAPEMLVVSLGRLAKPKDITAILLWAWLQFGDDVKQVTFKIDQKRWYKQLGYVKKWEHPS